MEYRVNIFLDLNLKHLSNQVSSGSIVAESATKIGWKPEWDKTRFLDNMDAEIDAVLANGEAKSSLLSSLSD